MSNKFLDWFLSQVDPCLQDSNLDNSKVNNNKIFSVEFYSKFMSWHEHVNSIHVHCVDKKYRRQITYVEYVIRKWANKVHCNPVQGQYRARTGFSLCSKFSQGKTCFHYREPLFSWQGPCIHYREFPVRITTQGNSCSHYREWVCSVIHGLNIRYFI